MEISREAYLKRLRQDLSRWAAQGHVAHDAIEALLADAARHFGVDASEESAAPMPPAEAKSRRMISALFLLAGVLLAAGVLSFIAANWEAMSRLARLALIVGGLWASGLLAVWLREQASARFAEGLFLLTAVLFGGGMVLVAQMYHISGDLPRFLLAWSLGALALSVLMGAQATGVLGLLLGLGWSLASVGVQLTEFGFARAVENGVRIHWPFLLVLMPAVALAMMHRWRWLARASVLAALAWAWQSVSNLAPGALPNLRHVVLTLPFIGVLAALTGLLLQRLSRLETRLFAPSLLWQGGLFAWMGLLTLSWPDLLDLWRSVHGQWSAAQISTAPAWLFHTAAILTLAIALAGAALRRLQWWEAAVPAILAGWLLLVAHATGAPGAPEGSGAEALHSWLLSKWTVFGMELLLAVWLLGIGLAHEVRAVWRLGLALFGITVFWLYVVTIGSLLNTAGFFLGAGLLLLALALAGWRFLRWVERQHATPEEGAV